MKPLVNIIIANWNGKELIDKCMEGLTNQVFKSFYVTIVDNGSTDDSVDYIEKNYPEAEIIALKKNTGFSIANNMGIKKSKTKYIALLNNDAIAHPLWLKNLIAVMESCPEIGFAGSKMLYHSNPNIIDRAGDIYTTAGTALLRGRGMPSYSFNQKEFVFGACAGAAIYRKEMLDEIGLFDEDFFLLYEDVDLSFRAQLHGYKCLYVPDAIVYHKVGSSIGNESNLSIYYTHRNLEWVYIKCMPLCIIPLTIFQHIIYILGSFLYFTSIGKSWPFIKAKYHALKGFTHFLKKRKELQGKKVIKNKYIWNILTAESYTNRILRRYRKTTHKDFIHILIDFTQIPLNKVGVGIYATNLIEEIARFSGKNKYTILVQDDENSLDNLEQNNFELIKVKSKFFRHVLFRILLEQFYIPYLIRKNQIDIIHSLHYTFPILPLRAKRIVTLHDISFFKFPELHKRLKRIYFKLFTRLLPKMANRIIIISQSTYNDFISLTGTSKNKLSLVPLGRPKWQHKSFSNKTVMATMDRMHIRNDYILYVGMIEPRKNITNIIHAFNKLLKSHKNYQLVIAGPKGWHYEPVFKLIGDLKLDNKIVLPGYITIDEKAILMKNAKIFVYPSLYEGFGLPVLEAMSLGVPTVTSNVSSMPEITGDAAVLINPESVEELYAGIKKLLDDGQLYNELKEKSVLRANQFSWEKTAKETVETYENMLIDKEESYAEIL